jgi:FkbM family methyltransferase
MQTFLNRYLDVIFSSLKADHADNYDEDRFGASTLPIERPSLKTRISRAVEAIGIVSRRSREWEIRRAHQFVSSALSFIGPHLASLEWLYGKVGDDSSREILVYLAAYRALGHRKVKLPTNTPKFWEARDLARGIPKGPEEIDAQFLGWKLHERSLERFGFPIRMFTPEGACYSTFAHEQYRCTTAEGSIACEKGDFAVDAGGCYGDTALYLAHLAGPTGRVASFEFLPRNLSIFRRNLSLNPQFSKLISIYPHPVYSRTGQELYVSGTGPGTRVSPETDDPAAQRVTTLKIDDLITRGDFPRIDFLKMDIEGAELEALRGSEAVLRRFKPKLAITVYHDFKDYWMIPEYLDSLGIGYRFYLRHFTIHTEETVLFAH